MPRSRWTACATLLPSIVWGLASALGQAPGTPVSLLPEGSSWRLWRGRSEASSPITAWRYAGFDDTAWELGPAPFYYGETVAAGTRINDMRYAYTTLFLRATVQIDDPRTLGQYTLRARIDDGFIAWINGVRVARYNAPEGEPLRTDTASDPIEPTYVDTPLLNPLDYLVPGPNLLAVQLFNSSLTSSDILFDASLTATIVETEPPTIQTVAPPPGIVSGLECITVTFNEPVIGVVAEDLLLNGLPARTVAGSGATHIFGFPRPAGALVDVSWDAEHSISDAAGNRFDETGPDSNWSYEIQDYAPPALLLVSPAPGSTVGWLTQIDVRFDEWVTGVDADDFLVNDAPATGMTGAGSGPYRFNFAEPASGTVAVAWAATHGITDLAAPPNPFGGGAWSYELDPTSFIGTVVISEILAVNRTGITDADGDTSDWIELYNRGASAIDLLGWSLSDDPDDPGRWVFPSIALRPGEYLLVFASGKDRTGGGELHTNFQLSGSGEFLALYPPPTPRQPASGFAPAYPVQRADISYGIGDTGGYQYSSVPTPEDENTGGRVFLGVAAPPASSVESGFYPRPFVTLLATATPAAEIYYTWDGREPTPAAGTRYVQPLSVAPGGGKGMATLRAAAYRDGYLPSEIVSYSFAFPESVLAQSATPDGFPRVWQTRTGFSEAADYGMDARIVNGAAYAADARAALTAIPTISLQLDPDDLFGPARGIYSNPAESGVQWERPASVEFILPDQARVHRVNAGLRMQGGSGRKDNKTDKYSLRLLFKGDYGPTKLEYPLFPDSPVAEFDTLVLDARMNYAWHYDGGVSPPQQRRRAQYTRDQYVSDLHIAMGWPSPHGRAFHVYLNGLYWGVFGVHERPDASFAAAHFGGEPEEYDSIKNTYGFVLLDGNLDAWNQAIAIANSGLASNAQYEQLQQYVDVTNLADYMLANFWVGNTDWPHHNWYVARRRQPGAQFKFFIWDAEHVLVDAGNNRTTVNNSNTPAQFYDQLRQRNAEFRMLFADRVQRHFAPGGVLYTDPDAPQWDPARPERNRPAAAYMRRIAEIEKPVVLESARWGDNVANTERPGQPYERDVEWLEELDSLFGRRSVAGHTLDYFPRRSATLLNQLRQLNLASTVAAPAFSQQGGWAPAGFALAMTAPAGTIFYTLDGTDPRQYGTGAPAVTADAYAGPVPLGGRAVVKARALGGNNWSALAEASFVIGQVDWPVRISEIMYHPPASSAHEFIELWNPGQTPVDLSGARLSGADYIFPPSSVMEPGTVWVLASGENPSLFQAQYPGVEVRDTFAGRLDNGGERLAFIDAAGALLLTAAYDDEAGWPAAADGGGYSLELVDPDGDSTDPGNWRLSAAPGGSPGWIEADPAAPAARFNEVMAYNLTAVSNDGAPCADWIEIHYQGPAAADLGGWSITDDGRMSRRFVIPLGTIVEPGTLILVWCDQDGAGPGLHSGFGLDRDGETLWLFDRVGRRVDVLTFGPQARDLALARIDDQWQLAAPTPGQPNTAAPLAPPDGLVINEWLADAAPGTADWLELHNTHPSLAVALHGLVIRATGGTARIAVPAFVGPSDFVRLWADDAARPDRLGFRLPATGGYLALHDADGSEIDRVDYGPQQEGLSQGRWPDGGANIAFLAAGPSPRRSNRASDTADSDGDGMPDGWELENGLDPLAAADAAGDLDGDGQPNADEHASGTDPLDPASVLGLRLAVGEMPATMNVSFPAEPRRSYSIEYSDGSPAGPWQPIADFSRRPAAVTHEAVDAGAAASSIRFYRIVTPSPRLQ